MLTDHTTDKILLLVVLGMVLAAGIYTDNPTVWDAFKVALGAAITYLGSRITNLTETK